MVGFGYPGIMGLFSEQHVVSHRCKVIPLKWTCSENFVKLYQLVADVMGTKIWK